MGPQIFEGSSSKQLDPQATASSYSWQPTLVLFLKSRACPLLVCHCYPRVLGSHMRPDQISIAYLLGLSFLDS